MPTENTTEQSTTIIHTLTTGLKIICRECVIQDHTEGNAKVIWKDILGVNLIQSQQGLTTNFQELDSYNNDDYVVPDLNHVLFSYKPSPQFVNTYTKAITQIRAAKRGIKVPTGDQLGKFSQ